MRMKSLVESQHPKILLHVDQTKITTDDRRCIHKWHEKRHNGTTKIARCTEERHNVRRIRCCQRDNLGVVAVLKNALVEVVIHTQNQKLYL